MKNNNLKNNLEIERKYLIAYPDSVVLNQIPEDMATRITQIYLKSDDSGFGRRIRERIFPDHTEYTYTRKKKIAFGERMELEDQISETQYQQLCKEADTTHQMISKIRYAIPYRNQILELDLYEFSRKLATLEIELSDINSPVQIPDWIHILADVTDQPGYSNFSLSMTLTFPEERNGNI
ncbi:MAG: hypothetical protein K2H29_07005 [Oscillospiraceae bacterium]|nr:hypothetical protein [Oscillospiraceae bacterium]MDE5884803.1 hypothetical protein [Oscillospiraceae bacterium]